MNYISKFFCWLPVCASLVFCSGDLGKSTKSLPVKKTWSYDNRETFTWTLSALQSALFCHYDNQPSHDEDVVTFKW